ncbi:MAG: 23S rRNA (adenine(2503)-C(2))-methyltransferase RlmN [candidate division KSB1 bacterium]|nr:23S rRNA (adenine(2503)-C(2))-methyltransferase RlmN [candidate division KSB1 bacterium]
MMQRFVEKQTLIGLNEAGCIELMRQLDEKPYRGRQLYRWLYRRRAASFAEMTDLPEALRQKLSETVEWGQLELVERDDRSSSGSIKYLFRLRDGRHIESVYIPDPPRHTVCVSSQAGCGLNCRFCATARLGLQRNLTVGEIIEQVMFIMRDRPQPITNVVFMGMGEPLANYEHVMEAADLLSDYNGLAIGARRIVISTAGLADQMIRYADEGRKYRLAVSLNSPFQEQRAALMPIAKRYPLDVLLKAAEYYAGKSRKILTFEYVLFADVNDSREHAEALKRIVKRIPSKLNLIPYNPTTAEFRRPDEERVNQFAQWLLPLHAGLSVRWSKGHDVNAACGQLAGRRMTEVQACVNS